VTDMSAQPATGLAPSELRHWRWLPCGCTVCYQHTLTWFSVDRHCPRAQALKNAWMELVVADLAPDRPPRLRFEDQAAANVRRAEAWYRLMDHVGPDPAADPDGAARWAAAVRARLPRYGFTPSGSPIHSTTDPGYGRAICVCGFEWADGHPPGDGTGCPEHLRHREQRRPAG
jgi:hypothetical protein